MKIDIKIIKILGSICEKESKIFLLTLNNKKILLFNVKRQGSIELYCLPLNYKIYKEKVVQLFTNFKLHINESFMIKTK